MQTARGAKRGREEETKPDFSDDVATEPPAKRPARGSSSTPAKPVSAGQKELETFLEILELGHHMETFSANGCAPTATLCGRQN